MTTNPLPDLSKWYEVPADADMTDARQVVALRSDNTWFNIFGPLSAKDRAPELRYFTADPIPAPRPAPPTTVGTHLLDVVLDDGSEWEGAVYAGGDGAAPWLLYGPDTNCWASQDEFRSWRLAVVEPAPLPESDVLDENDHRDRIDKDGDTWRRKTRTKGAGLHWTHSLPYGTYSLAQIARECGPLRFADQDPS